ncbi:hypothetical protein [Acinetobacter pittii]|uniref:hypothetical protein n=1 Tax=Acinetobacter pittii TaxID=48296 RepID=UPI0039F464A3
MKSTPDQAISDLAFLIYLNTIKLFEDEKIEVSKDYFLIECLKLVAKVKMVEFKISSYNQTITFELDKEKHSFWLVEIPDVNEKCKFVDYLTSSFLNIFYNINIKDF